MGMITIRQLLPDDFAILRQIRLEALRLHPQAYSSAYEDWEKLTEQQWREKLTIPVYAAFAGDEPVGLIGLLVQHGERTDHRGVIVMVYVQNQLRGQGIAKQLLASINDHARGLGVSQLELSVAAANHAAHQLYLREGFVEFGRRPNWIRLNGAMFDEVLMLRAVL